MSAVRLGSATESSRIDEVRRLLDRAEIESALARYCRAVDRIDSSALATVFHPGAVVRKAGSTMTRDEFVGGVVRRHSEVVAASHMITNVMVDWVDADKAFVQSYCLAVERHDDSEAVGHCIDYVHRVRYGDVFERRDEGWRIIERQYVTDHIMAVPVTRSVEELMSTRVQGLRSSADVIEVMRASVLGTGYC